MPMTPQKIILASNNNGKLKELSITLASLNIELVSQSTYQIESVDETGLSFIENALIKARHASKITKLPAIADDSGLVVPALNGEPGIYSSRYSGNQANDQTNIDCLLKKMQTITNRDAYFYCALVFVYNALDPAPLFAIGKFHGEITTNQSGMGGFGYDPIFYIKQHKKTAAQLSSEEKNKISHRAIASQKLLEIMKKECI